MIEIVILIVAGIHCLVFLFLYVNLRSLRPSSNHNEIHSFSIIVPVRNEDGNILDLLNDLSEIDYPMQSFEVIVVDDSSDDRTAKIVQEFSAPYPLKYLLLNGGRKGKKPAIEYGVAEAKFDLVLTTDGDCRVQPNWLKAMSSGFQGETKMVVGPVKMEPRGIFGLLQAIDFSILIGYAANLVRLGIPSMSNGANLAYRRATFIEVEGYKGNHHVPSGDDEFLLMKVSRRYPESVRFINDPEAVVSTDPKSSFGSLLNQRKRWLSKWTLHKNGHIILSVLLILIDNLAMILGWVGLFLGWVSPWFLIYLMARVLVKVLFSNQVNKLLKAHHHFVGFCLYELIYPFYVLLLSFASIFGTYTWKGRKYS